MRSIWKGALSFGLINIPINVYSASEENALSFDMLHKKDLSPIRYARICKLDGKEIPYNEIVKGYEFEKGEYVVVDEQDFEAANAKKTKTIDIQCFVDMSEIDSIYFSKPYYLEPDKKAQKAYQLLKEALKKSKKVAIANFVFRNKEHIGAVIAYEDILILHQLRYATELRSYESLDVSKSEKFTKQEMEMALKLVDQLSVRFDIKKYKDTYTEELVAAIEDKVRGKKPAKKTKEPQYTSSRDLMHQLKQSLEGSLKQTSTKKSAHVVKSPTKRTPKRKHV